VNNRQQTFFSAADRRIYLALLKTHCRRWRLDVLGYCLMPNHVHLIVIPERDDSLAKALGRTHYDYAVYLNGRRRRSGHLWQNRFYSTVLEGSHLQAALRYVDLNPVRARLAKEATQYEWSSAGAHVAGRDPEGLLELEWWKETFPLQDWAEALLPTRDDEMKAEEIRRATRTGRPLGDEAFVRKLEDAQQRTLRREKPGPKRPRSAAATAGG
jgi:putative transposase